MDLTREQRRIVRTKRPRVEVTAPPGSGKSEVICERDSYLISEGQNPERILNLSFSNNAVENIEERLRSVKNGDRVVVLTCHRFASTIIAANLDYLKLKRVPKPLADKELAKTIAKAIAQILERLTSQLRKAGAGTTLRRRIAKDIKWLARQQRQSRKSFVAAFMYAAASRSTLAKLAERRDFGWIAGHERASEAVHKAYKLAKADAGSCDYGDYLRLAIKALRSPGTVRGVEFDHLIVDEYQDTSPAQAQLFRYLARRIPNLMVVGDPRQAVFGFGGAVYTPLGDLVDGVRIMPLTQSFRLPQPLADFATALCFDGKAAAQPIIGRKGGAKPILIHVQSDEQQSHEVARRIQRLLADGTDPREIAVLSRISFHLVGVEMRLKAIGIPAQRQGPGNGDGAPEHVKNVLRLVAVLDQPEFGGQEVADALPQTVAPAVLAEVTRRCRIAARGRALDGRFRQCLGAYLYAIGASKKKREEIEPSLNSWVATSRKFHSASAMLKAVTRMAAKDSVVTSTIHRAKGREWEHVFVINCTDKILPFHVGLDDAKLLEERNLLFVAATRASTSLTLVHAPQTLLVKHKKLVNAQEVSRFLNHPRVLARLDVQHPDSPQSQSKG